MESIVSYTEKGTFSKYIKITNQLEGLERKTVVELLKLFKNVQTLDVLQQIVTLLTSNPLYINELTHEYISMFIDLLLDTEGMFFSLVLQINYLIFLYHENISELFTNIANNLLLIRDNIINQCNDIDNAKFDTSQANCFCRKKL